MLCPWAAVRPEGIMVARKLLQGSWRHSHEEDTEDAMVYRRAGFAFPPSRGRHGLDLRADGTGADQGIGPTDAKATTPVAWALDPDDTVTLTDASGKVLRRMRIASAGKSRLVVRR
jgi:hypothetical protein